MSLYRAAFLASAPPSGVPQTGEGPSDRATTFQPVEGGEQHSGTTLMVEAYAVIWTVLLLWVLFMWRKQSSLNDRLTDLEVAIDRAAAKRAPAGSPEPRKVAPKDGAADKKLGGETA
jgi:CcmD family protein